MWKTVSLVMIVKNEALSLGRCLESVQACVDEIIIVDTGSTDSTKQVAAEYGARIFDYVWNEDFAGARNFALNQSTSDWNLVLDADEFIANMGKTTIQRFINKQRAIGTVRIISEFMGNDGVNYEQNYISRLFPSECRYEGKIHEQIVSDLPRYRIDIDIQHDGYFQTSKAERNVPILLQEIASHPQEPYYYFQIAKEYRGLERHEETFVHLRQAYKKITRQESYAPSLIINYLYSMIASGHLSEGLDVIEQEQKFLNDYADYYFVSALYILELVLSNPDKFNELIPHIERFYLSALKVGDSEHEGSVIGTGSFAAHHNLGVFYEVTGKLVEARQQYMKAAAYDYQPSLERLKVLN